MPTHVYQPVRTPPSWLDRLLVHPLDATVATISLLYGLLSAASLAFPGFTPSNSVEQLPWVAVYAVTALWAVGGAMALTGIFWAGDTVSTGWTLERIGWLFTSGGLLVYGISAAQHYPESVFSWITPLLLGVGGVLRFVSVYLIERNTRRVIAEVQEPPRDN